MSGVTSVSVGAFFSHLQNAPKHPSGQLRRSEASKIQNRFGVSLGKEESRLYLDDLDDECFRVAASFKRSCFSFGEYALTRITVNGQSQKIWINVNSVMKRLDLPRDVVLRNLSNLSRIVRLVREKMMFQVPEEEKLFNNEGDIGVPLLPIGNQFPSLVPLEQIARKAHEQKRCFRLSKRCYHLAKSIDVLPDGYIAVDTGIFLGKGGNGKVKISETLDGKRIARKSCRFHFANQRDEERILRMLKIFNEFKGKTGILDTLSIGVYENKNGVGKFVSFHPLFDQDLSIRFRNPPTEKDRLKMAHELLQGFVTIEELGVHRDLSYKNILVQTTGSFGAVIADLEFFRYHEEGIDQSLNPSVGPEQSGLKREVWDFGKILYYVLRTDFRILPWDCVKAKRMITQRNLDDIMRSAHFPIELETLLKGMLAIDSNVRWTAKQSLDHFKKYLDSRQDL